jgi:hypothetical protein
MKTTIAIFLLASWVLTTSLVVKTTAPALVFPTPPQNENSLFYIQRSKNTNAIVYEANMKSEGVIDPNDPVKIFWIRYSEDSTTAPLTYVQQKFAYGLKAKPYPGRPGQYVLVFSSYEKKQIYLLKKQDGKHFAAYTIIGGKFAELKKIFLQISGGSFWFPNIDYIDISGTDMGTGKPITERFKPLR